jgi:hypothetical protein
MTSRFGIAAVLLFLIVGCGSSLQYTKRANGNFDKRKDASEIKMLYDTPERDYRTLGTINWDYYEPGMSSPNINDAAPELRKKAATEGGDALIIRQQQPSPGQNKRVLRITAEVVRYE